MLKKLSNPTEGCRSDLKCILAVYQIRASSNIVSRNILWVMEQIYVKTAANNNCLDFESHKYLVYGVFDEHVIQ